MTIAQCKATRRRMLARYGNGLRFGWSVTDAIEREKMKAERERAAQASKRKKAAAK